MTKRSRIQPLGENVLIQPAKIEKKTATGIYLPETASEERRQQGIVVAIGDDTSIKLKKGASVIFKRYGSSEEVEIDGVEYVIVAYKDILAVIE
jgi:chaperonin GroES